MAENKKTRDSGMELLRIICMFMVIGVHACARGYFYDSGVAVGGFVASCTSWIRLLFRPAVNTFVLITGYYMVKTKFNIAKSYKRVLRLYVTVLFYSIVLSVIFLIAGPKYYNIDGNEVTILNIVLKMFFPVLSRRWYFITDYILLCLFAPFLNIILQNIKKKDYKLLLAITTFVMCIWFFLAKLRAFDHVIVTYAYVPEGKNVFCFLYIYMIGGYIRLHVKKQEKANPKYLLYAVGCWALNRVLELDIMRALELEDIVTKYTNPLVILMAVFWVMYFKDLHFYSNTINKVASTTLGVYIIHEFTFIRALLWNWFDFRKMDCSNMLLNLVYLISIIVLVFVVCSALDWLRQKLFATVENKFKVSKNNLSAKIEG